MESLFLVFLRIFSKDRHAPMGEKGALRFQNSLYKLLR